MKHIILDHFRRRAWLFAVAALVQVALGWAHAFFAAKNTNNFTAIFQYQLGAFFGAFLLSLDFQRGITRVVACLPLTAAQIGRAWWLATVALPATFFSALLLLGTASFHLIQPGHPVAWERLGISMLTLFLMLGSSFTLIFQMLPGGDRPKPWDRTVRILAMGLWILLLSGGGSLFQNTGLSPSLVIIALSLGVSLTVFGALRTESFVRTRSSFRLTSASSAPAAAHATPARTTGLSGLPLLFINVTGLGFLVGLAVLLSPLVLTVFEVRGMSWSSLGRMLASSSQNSLWPAVIIIPLRVLPQLRHLRTLPLSSDRLAATLLGMILVPLFALGAVAVGLGSWLLDAESAQGTAQLTLLTLIPASLALATLAWTGLSQLAFGSVICLSMMFHFGLFFLLGGPSARILPLAATASLTGAFVILAFFLIRTAFRRGSRVYRHTLMGAYGWPGGAIR